MRAFSVGRRRCRARSALTGAARSALAAIVASAVAVPARASENDTRELAPAADSGESSAQVAAAIRSARAELDAMVGSLLREHSDAAGEPRPEIRVDVTPSTLTSDAPTPRKLAPEPRELSWLEDVELPDIPIRWHEQLLDLLTYYRDDARARAHLRGWLQRSGRYDAMIRAQLKEAGLPLDLTFVAMVESGFDPFAESTAGAVGIWQLVDTTARDYGLEKSRWLDERKNPERATEAAVRYLKDLHDKLGSWPLTLAAFNMGYSALLRSVRKYNTNDFWLLARLEAGLPYETVAYVAKVMACAIIAHNPERFGLSDVVKDRPLDLVSVQVPGGTMFGRVSGASLISIDSLRELNPELLKKRVPPDVKHWALRIPRDKAARFAKHWPLIENQAPSYATHVMRFGERIKDVAEMYGTTEQKLRALNDLGSDDPAPSGTRLIVPDVQPVAPSKDAEPVVVGLPRHAFNYPGRRHIFYRVRGGDSARTIARFFHVSLDELRTWNEISTDATLQYGMIVQLFVPADVDLRNAVYLTEDRVRGLVVGSDEFFEYHEALRDRVRVRYRVQPNESLSSLAERFDLSVGSIARINGFSPSRVLEPGSEIVLYVPTKQASRLDQRQLARE